MSLPPGTRLGPYEIVDLLGVGGMGEVYRARDTRLDRTVAIKVLSPGIGNDREFRSRFEREARLASALDHPHICTIFDVGHERDTPYLVMQYVRGETLAALLARGILPLDVALEYAGQIASALSAAHRAGILHRDLKPANIMVTDGLAKILDFGLAKSTVAPSSGPADDTATISPAEATALTRAGVAMGTAAYMSPEQVQGHSVDTRTDVFSFGALLYEMLAGRSAFSRDSVLNSAFAVLHDSPSPLRHNRPDIPPDLNEIVRRCLEKDPSRRYQSAVDLHHALRASQAALTSSSARWSRSRRLGVVGVAAILVLVTAGWIGWTTRRHARTRSAIDSLPEIARLSERGEYAAAFRLAEKAQPDIPGDRRLAELWPEISLTVSVQTEPPDADIRIKEYGEPDAPWRSLGRSPTTGLRVSRGLKRWRITKPEYESIDAARAPEEGPAFKFILDREQSVPDGMVHVIPATASGIGLTGLDHLQAGMLDAFHIDRHEVTNEAFAQFVRAGGYRQAGFWKHPFIKDQRRLSFAEAMNEFHDSTGRPGPASWELGGYPAGEANLPVTGVSWYEAMAYAAYAGKDLPTVHHWVRAAVRQSLVLNNSPVLQFSNFAADRPAAVGSRYAMNPYGTYDMAGNVKEWCVNEATRRGGARYILGGGYDEPVYMAHDPDAQAPFSRLPTYGFRCVKYMSPLPASLAAPIEYPSRDFRSERPISDAEFKVLRRFYTYDRTNLDARIDATDQTSAFWRLEKISFNAAYGGERMAAYLFLPRGVKPPYQVVIHFPGSAALRERSFEARLARELSPQQYLAVGVSFLVQSGRAVLFPIYKSTYERGDGLLSDRPNLTSGYRDHVVQWAKDVSRSIDYLQTRSDIDSQRIGYYGVSWGSTLGAIIPAVEDRLRAVVLVVGGFWQQRAAPEVEQINFAPRVTVPVLMLNGRHDFVFPLETSQMPMFNLLGTPAQNKRHVPVDSGHSVPARTLVTHTLQWFDKYLGPAGQ